MRVQETHPEARDKITRVMHHVDQSIQIKRRLIEDLRPTVLLNLGLREAIVQLVEGRRHAQRMGDRGESARDGTIAARRVPPSRCIASCRNR